jgi:Nuclease-related domain
MNGLLQKDLMIPVIFGVVLLLVLLVGVVIYQKRKSQRPAQRLRSAVTDVLSNFLIPNGEEGEITVEYALLTHRGIVIVDIKDVAGNIFGSDSMQDWTVISDKHRFTFGNPQFALYDRLAAVRRLVAGIPVTGYIVFTNRGRFSKGQPSDVILLDTLINNLKADGQNDDTQTIRTRMPQWDQLRKMAVTTQVDQLLKS